jgi:hypothetical protein
VTKCPYCDGRKPNIKTFSPHSNFTGFIQVVPCPYCDGSGSISQEEFDRYVKRLSEQQPAQATSVASTLEIAILLRFEIARLLTLREEGVITQEEYDKALREINGKT